MPVTIELMGDRGSGYIGTVFKPQQGDAPRWDGMAQMFLDAPLPNPPEGFGAKPVDSFHERAVEPYFGLATREYVLLDGSEQLPVRPLTLGGPFPTSRSGFYKVIAFYPSRPDMDDEQEHNRWLSQQAERTVRAMQRAHGFRYVLSLAMDPAAEPYACIEELYFPDRSAWQRFIASVRAEGGAYSALQSTAQVFFADTEFVAIPLQE